MTELLNAIKEFFEWFNSTPLPKDTADFIVDILRDFGTKFLILAREYIDIFFPGV